MTDRALANAEKRRDDIAARINKLNQELEALRKDMSGVETFIVEWHKFATDEQDSGTVPAEDSQEDTGFPQAGTRQRVIDRILSDPTPQPSRKNPEKSVVGQHAKSIIEEKGRPVPRSELYSELAYRNLHIYGKDPEMVLSTMMWRMQDDFVRLPRFGYWLRNKPFSAAGYEPGAIVEQDQEDFDLLQKSILDPASMPDVDPSELIGPNGLPAAAIQFNNYLLRPQRSNIGWQVHIEAMNSSEPTRTTMNFSTVNAAIEEAKSILSGARLLSRRI